MTQLSVFRQAGRVLPTNPTVSLRNDQTQKNMKKSFQIQSLLKKHNISNKISPLIPLKLQSGTYYGPVVNELPQGFGMIKFNDKSVVYGSFQKGNLNGKAFKYQDSGQYFVGDFQNNQRSGNGYYFNHQYQYKGQFHNDQPHGKGQINWKKDNAKFVGLVENGMMKKGKLTWDLKPFKQGREEIPAQFFTYEGAFRNNKFQDEKATLKSNAGQYQGSFKQGKKCGRGKFVFPQKYHYDGQYKDDLKNGFGTLYNPFIKLVKEQIVDEKRGNEKRVIEKEVNEVTTLQSYISYRGQFKNNIPHGRGSVWAVQLGCLKQAVYEQGVWVDVLPKK